jgi:hypothetical protein
MVAFDVPDESYHEQPFEKRYAELIPSICPSHPFLVSQIWFLLVVLFLSRFCVLYCVFVILLTITHNICELL